MAAPATTTGDIIQVATGLGMATVTTLVKAVEAAGLVDALKGPGPFTVFAPTNDAFAKLPPDVLADLLKPENKDKLASILLYHVHAGEAVASTNLKPGNSQPSMARTSTSISMARPSRLTTRRSPRPTCRPATE